MRTVLLFVPALICAGSMLMGFRMMTRGHHDERSPASRDEEPIS